MNVSGQTYRQTCPNTSPSHPSLGADRHTDRHTQTHHPRTPFWERTDIQTDTPKHITLAPLSGSGQTYRQTHPNTSPSHPSPGAERHTDRHTQTHHPRTPFWERTDIQTDTPKRITLAPLSGSGQTYRQTHPNTSPSHPSPGAERHTDRHTQTHHPRTPFWERTDIQTDTPKRITLALLSPSHPSLGEMVIMGSCNIID